jgi:hypothetical protein
MPAIYIYIYVAACDFVENPVRVGAFLNGIRVC